MGKRLKIGIFGGTLDPIHYGHLRAAEEVRGILGLDRIIFIPSAVPPFKRHTGVAEISHRIEMARIAVAGNPLFEVSDIETHREGVSYSVDTVEALRSAHPDADFSFIIGLDAFRDIAAWKDYRRLLTICSFIVVSRPGFEKGTIEAALPLEVKGEFCYDPVRGLYRHGTGQSLRLIEVTLLDISSTDIRSRLRSGGSVRYLLPDCVIEYIKEQGLYGVSQDK